MRRRLFTQFALLCVLLFLGTGFLWLRSRMVRDYAWVFIPLPADQGTPRFLKLDFDSGGGQFQLSWKTWTAGQREQVRQSNPLAGQASYHNTFDEIPRAYARAIPPTGWNAFGFYHYSGPTHSSVAVPYWSSALIAAPLPIFWLRSYTRRRRRKRAGQCSECGYDLRATPERCPECGAAVKPLAN